MLERPWREEKVSPTHKRPHNTLIVLITGLVDCRLVHIAYKAVKNKDTLNKAVHNKDHLHRFRIISAICANSLLFLMIDLVLCWWACTQACTASGSARTPCDPPSLYIIPSGHCYCLVRYMQSPHRTTTLQPRIMISGLCLIPGNERFVGSIYPVDLSQDWVS